MSVIQPHLQLAKAFFARWAVVTAANPQAGNLYPYTAPDETEAAWATYFVTIGPREETKGGSLGAQTVIASVQLSLWDNVPSSPERLLEIAGDVDTAYHDVTTPLAMPDWRVVQVDKGTERMLDDPDDGSMQYIMEFVYTLANN